MLLALQLALLHPLFGLRDADIGVDADVPRDSDGAPDRSGVIGVQAAGDPQIAFGDADAVGWIEADPAQVRQPGLRPAMGFVQRVAIA